MIIGGAKISTKTKVVKKFLDFADHLLLGGALASTVFQAKGLATGKSLTEKEIVGEVQKLNLTNPKLHLPVDVLVSKDASGQAEIKINPVDRIEESEIILDIGPDTVRLFGALIKNAKTIIWNGPMGLAEVEAFSSGTRKIARAVIDSRAYSVVGGGDTISILREMGLAEKMSYLSTGGGAMLEFLAEGTLAGIKALNK